MKHNIADDLNNAYSDGLRDGAHWWKYQKPGKEYYGLTIRGRCSELESEISYLDDVIQMLEKAEVEG